MRTSPDVFYARTWSWLFAALMVISLVQAAERPPNVILVVADDSSLYAQASGNSFYRTTSALLGDHKPGMDGWPGEYLKQSLTAPELYNMLSDVKERHNVAAEHPDLFKRLLDQAEQCRTELGDTTLNHKGSGVREAGRLPE